MIKASLETEIVGMGSAQPRQMKALESSLAIVVPWRGQERLNVTTEGGKCWAYQVERSVHDTIFTVNTFDGKPIMWQVYQTHNQNENVQIPERPNGQEVLIRSDQLNQLRILVTSSDRWRFGTPPKNNLLYLCPFSNQIGLPISAEISVLSKESGRRFPIQDGETYNFILSSKEYLYYVYTNQYLPNSAQDIFITVSVETVFMMQVVPRVMMKVCPYEDPDTCYLTPDEAVSFQMLEVLPGIIVGDESTTFRTRISNISHSPLSCPRSLTSSNSRCSYLLSIFNPSNYGPVKVSVQVESSAIMGAQVITLDDKTQSQQGVVEAGRYMDFMIKPGMNIGNEFDMIRVKSRNGGRASLYAKVGSKARLGNSIVSASSLSNVVDLFLGSSFNSTEIIFFSIYAESQLFYDLVLTNLNSTLISNTLPIIPSVPIILPISNISVNQSQVISDTFPSRAITMTLKNPNNTIFLVPKDELAYILWPTIDQKNGNVSFLYNISSLNLFNQTDKLLIEPSPSRNPIRLDIRFFATFGAKATQVEKDRALIKLTFKLLALPKRSPSQGDGSLYLNQGVQVQTYIGGKQEETTLMYRRMLMDTAANYDYKITSLFGTANLMVRVGPGEWKMMNIKDDSSFNYATMTTDVGSQSTLRIDPSMRRLCVNNTFSMRGGNHNCTMYIGVQCEDICAFILTLDTLTSRNNSISEPTLLQQGMLYNNTLAAGSTILTTPTIQYYFIPYNRSQDDIVLALDKLNQDLFLTATLSSQAHLPYQNWTFPTLLSNHFISYTNTSLTSNEVLSITKQQLLDRCPQLNLSCVVIVGVGASNKTQKDASYTLRYIDNNRRIRNGTFISGVIGQKGGKDEYWFVIQAREINQNRAINWTYLMTTETPYSNEVDIYASYYQTNSSSPDSSDYQAIQQGSDALTISSRDLQAQLKGRAQRILVLVSVYSPQGNSSYNFLLWGPNAYNETFFDLRDSQQIRFDTSLPNQFRIYRYFSYGKQQVRFNVSSLEGNVTVITSTMSLRSPQNPYFRTPIPGNTNNSLANLVAQRQSYRFEADCSFCWIYIGIYQNNSSPQRQSKNTIVNLSVNETLSLIPEIKSQIFARTSFMQRKLRLDNFYQFMINVTGRDLTVFLTKGPDYQNLPKIWQSTNQTSHVLSVKFPESQNYDIGTDYILTFLSNTPQNVSLIFWQDREILLLRNATTIQDIVIHRDDIVKYFAVVPPPPGKIYLAYITITYKTPGYQPIVYSLANNISNTTYNFQISDFSYPSPFNFTRLFQKPYDQQQNQTLTFLLNVTSETVQVTTQPNQQQTGMQIYLYTNKNTYHTLALYWTKFLAGDVDTCEYSVSVIMRAQPDAPARILAIM